MLSLPQFPDSVIIGACERFIKDDTTMEIRDWVNDALENLGIVRDDISREQVYTLIRIAKDRGFFLISPPEEIALRDQLVPRFDLKPEELRVIGTRDVLDHVASAAAQAAVELIEELSEKKDELHIGIGGGWTTMLTARHLASRLRLAERRPKRMKLHALSTGFDVMRPQNAPVSFFSVFDHVGIEMKCIGLFAQAMVDSGDYKKVRQSAGVKEAFDAIPPDGFDLVITSLGDASHQHGDFCHFMEVGSKRGLGVLRKCGWVGDVQYRPYSPDGPILADTVVRSVTLLELKDLVALASQPDKHVIVIAGPCGQCGMSRSAAVHPLLANKKLKLWTRFVMDITTAEEVLGMP